MLQVLRCHSTVGSLSSNTGESESSAPCNHPSTPDNDKNKHPCVSAEGTSAFAYVSACAWFHVDFEESRLVGIYLEGMIRMVSSVAIVGQYRRSLGAGTGSPGMSLQWTEGADTSHAHGLAGLDCRRRPTAARPESARLAAVPSHRQGRRQGRPAGHRR